MRKMPGNQNKKKEKQWGHTFHHPNLRNKKEAFQPKLRHNKHHIPPLSDLDGRFRDRTKPRRVARGVGPPRSLYHTIDR